MVGWQKFDQSQIPGENPKFGLKAQLCSGDFYHISRR